jgi:hypothetical protein
MAGVCHEGQTATIGDLSKCAIIARLASIVHCNHGPGSTGDFSSDLLRIDQEGVRVDISENRGRPPINYSIRCRSKGDRRNDNFISRAYPDREHRGMQGRCTTGNGYRVSGSGNVCDRLLELIHHWTGGQPV